MKIVIVDDDIFVSGALTTILEASGKVTVAASGTDGKEAAGCTSYGYSNERKKRT